MIVGSLGANALGAEGISLSQDGVTWLDGTGAYGKGWGDAGKGINVVSGSTFYVRYYSEAKTHPVLHIAPHGAEWGSWRQTGPSLGDRIGGSAQHPIILKFQNVGTPKSTITWENGSGSWDGIPFPGHYDLALQRDAIWSLPPVTITSANVMQNWWQRLLGASPDIPTQAGTASVPDAGATVVLLVIALAGLAILLRSVNHRHRRPRRSDSSSIG